VAVTALKGSPALGILAFTAAAVAAFLAFNVRAPWRREAGVFLGDAGSLTLGFALVWFAVDLTQGEAAVLRPITMVWIFGLPIADTIYLFLRRMLRGQSPFKADLFHFHHLLLALGLSQGRTTAAWLAIAALYAAAGLAGEAYGGAEVVMFWGYVFAFLSHAVVSTYVWRRLEPRGADAAQTAG
jgi:UDP-GlcNAc:undecaprenyl-phosphate GlcNAc-1-phosphate transferase